jgi:hypothetical protein
MWHLITFSGRPYEWQTEQIVHRAPGYGAGKVHVYDDVWLRETGFFRQNQWLWEHHGDRQNHKRGFGWFAWKPFVILDALERAEDGDVVLFLDADCYPIHDLGALYSECERNGGVMLFNVVGAERFNYMWCKRDCFLVMGQDDPKYWYAPAGVARFMLFQRGPWKAKQFLMEWLTYCVNPLATTFDENKLGHPDIPAAPGDQRRFAFAEHRTEQAIMTNLAHKYGFKLYRECCQFGNQVDPALYDAVLDGYPQMFIQDGRRVTDDGTGSKFRNVPQRTE